MMISVNCTGLLCRYRPLLLRLRSVLFVLAQSSSNSDSVMIQTISFRLKFSFSYIDKTGKGQRRLQSERAMRTELCLFPSVKRPSSTFNDIVDSFFSFFIAVFSRLLLMGSLFTFARAEIIFPVEQNTSQSNSSHVRPIELRHSARKSPDARSRSMQFV